MPIDKSVDYLPNILTDIPGPISQKLTDQSQVLEPTSITRFNSFKPIFRSQAFRSNVIDVDGNLFVDFTCSFGASFLGHNNPAIITGIIKQANRLIHSMGDVSPSDIRTELARILAGFFSYMHSPQVLFANSGSESIEIALKTAFLYTGKPGVISFIGNFHGQTIGALSVTGHSEIRNPFKSIISNKTAHFRFPRIGESDNIWNEILSEIELHILKNEDGPNAVGCIIFESIQNPHGYIIPPDEFLHELQNIANSRSILTIADEIFTGFGRTGKMFAFEHFDITPDIVCVGKILGGGIPIAACITSKDVFKCFESNSFLSLHGSTFGGNPISCQAALSTLNFLIEDDVVEKSVRNSTYLHEKILDLSNRYPDILTVRCIGMLCGIEIVTGKGEQEDFESTLFLANHTLQHGLFVLLTGIPTCNVIGLAPAYNISQEQINYLVQVLDSGLEILKLKR